MVNIRSGTCVSPFNHTINLMQDAAFQQSNSAFKGTLHLKKQAGHDVSHAKSAISPEDLELLREEGFASWKRCPYTLQKKVWFNILYHIGKRAQEGVHKYQKDSFGLGKTVAGKKYIFQKFNQVSKCSQGDESSASKCQKIDTEYLMFEIGDDMCPFAYFCLYLNKLNEDLDALWQCPNLYCRKPESMRWYDKQKIREHTMCKWMMELSVQCGLSQKYTNHCIRKTCTTAMAKSGFQPHQIVSITKH